MRPLPARGTTRGSRRPPAEVPAPLRLPGAPVPRTGDRSSPRAVTPDTVCRRYVRSTMGTKSKAALLMLLAVLGIALAGGPAHADGAPSGSDIQIAQTLGARE